MKTSRTLLLGSFLLTSLSFVLGGCVADGYVGVREDVYYGPGRDPWFRDDPWMDGHGWYGRGRGRERGGSVDIYIAPPRIRLP
jgi:hypothetical protein